MGCHGEGESEKFQKGGNVPMGHILPTRAY